jgi:2-polyprenyl-6-methoxyphenol hydroxylase-like FAD-dependent oxidoreductase
MGLAVDLALRGVECVVVERHVRPQRIPKGQNLTQRTMEHFAFWGVEDQIRNARRMPPGYPDSGVTAYKNLMGEYSYPWWRRSAVSDYFARANARIPQYETERVLRERAAALDVNILHGWSAERLTDGHSVKIVNRESARESEIEGEYIVGTDGAHSTIREEAGISQDLSDHDRRMVLLVFRSPGLHDALQRFGEVSFYNIMDPALDGYWRFLGRVDAAGEWFFHAPVPAEATQAPDFERCS